MIKRRNAAGVSYLQHFALIVVGAAVGLMALEVTLRTIGLSPAMRTTVLGGAAVPNSPRTFQYQDRPDVGRENPDDDSLYVETATGARLRPNTTCVIENHFISGATVTVSTNSLGFRGPELGPKIKRRVLFLGDSITMEDFKDEEDTWVRLVERRLAGSNPPWEAINAGVGGTSLRNYFELLKEKGAGTDPDVVFVGLYLNDFHPSMYYKPPRVPAWVKRSWVALHLINRWGMRFGIVESTDDRISAQEQAMWEHEVDERFSMLEPERTGADEFKRMVLSSIDIWGGAWSEGAWNIMQPILREMRDYLRVRGIQMLVGIFPRLEQVTVAGNFDFPQRRLAEIVRELGLPPLLDFMPLLRKAPQQSDEPLFFDMCHLTERGGRIVADAVYEDLRMHAGAVD